MKVSNFDQFLSESESIQENTQGGGNKFILWRFGTQPNPNVTKFFMKHAIGRPFAGRTPAAIYTAFETALTKEALISGLDALGITYDLYQVVHTSSGGTGNAQVAREPSASVEQLKARLAKALAADEFETAARLRDEIAQREGRPVGSPSPIGNELGENENIEMALMTLANTKAFPEIQEHVKKELRKMLTEGIKF